MRKYDYTGKTVFLGMDVHKKTYAVTAICDGVVIKRDTLKANPTTLITYAQKYFVGAKIVSAYEAGFCGFHLHRTLEAAGIENIIVDAASMEVAAGNRVKTDKRDSLKIATHLYEGRLKGIHIPTPEREDKRAVTRLRDTFVGQRSRVACQIKALLHQHGMIAADSKQLISVTWIKELKNMSLPKGLKFALDQYMDLWLHLNLKVKEIQEEMALQAEEDKALEGIYTSVPGIGVTSARVLANELEDTLQFSNERKLFSYMGLTPSEHSSGEHVRQGHITRKGKPILRKILVQAAWKAITLDMSLGEIFTRLATRVGKRKAIIGIARRLIGRIRSCFRTGELYRVKTDEKDNERYMLEMATIA
ncbi:MAG: IS110 family transposase [Chlamydiales bacterium]|nr:IS110 family transposase [Chlamydiales bacterium]